MTKLLEMAFEAAAKLPPEQQDALASALLRELESQQRWDQLFAAAPDLLASLAEEALKEDRAGYTKPL